MTEIICGVLTWWLIVMPAILLYLLSDGIQCWIKAKADEAIERARKLKKENNH